MLICSIGWTVCSAVYQDLGNAGAGRAVIVFIWLFSVSYALAWSFGGLHRRDHAFQDKSEGIDGYESLDSGCTGDQSVRPAMLRISSGILGFILACLEFVLL
jgi:hypothetical protein